MSVDLTISCHLVPVWLKVFSSEGAFDVTDCPSRTYKQHARNSICAGPCSLTVWDSVSGVGELLNLLATALPPALQDGKPKQW